MEQFSFSYQKTTVAELPINIQNLIHASEDVARHAYAPYSNFKVGAAALLADGSTMVCANHENASYPAGTCAERGLLAHINPTETDQRIRAITVSYISDAKTQTPLSPCGICRQTILEQQLAQGSPIAIYMCSTDGHVIYVDDATHLLPFYFSSKNLDL